MNLLFDSLAFTRALGWTIVHSVWQIACIFLIFKIIGWGLGHRNLMRYRCSLLAMSACAIWSVLTFDSLYQSLKTVAVGSLPQTYGWFSTSPYPTAIPTPLSESTWQTVVEWLDEHSAVLGWLWCLGVAALSLRLAGGYWLTRRLRRQSQPIADEAIVVQAQALARRMEISRPVQYLENQHIGEPLTLGFWKPVILFPVGLLLQLTPAQVEVLLLHELAHIRRHDYLVNLFQLALEVCFFYHPLFWLLSREARTRREYCCDDLVLRCTTNPLLYAQTLTTIKLTSLHHQNAFAMSATGKNNFTLRIQRMLGVAPERAQRSQPVLLLLLLAGLVAGAGWPTTTNATPESSPIPGITSTFLTMLPRDTVPEPAKPVRPSKPATVATPALAPTPATIATPASQPKPAPAATPASMAKPAVAPKPVSDPAPSLRGRVSGTITKEEFLTHPEVTLLFEAGENKGHFKVASYEITVLPNKQTDACGFVSHEPILKGEILTKIEALEPGSSIFIDNILVKSTDDSETRNLGGLAFTIKE